MSAFVAVFWGGGDFLTVPGRVFIAVFLLGRSAAVFIADDLACFDNFPDTFFVADFMDFFTISNPSVQRQFIFLEYNTFFGIWLQICGMKIS
jgi:hypothetical protein